MEQIIKHKEVLKEKKQTNSEIDDASKKSSKLFLLNDDVNSFDHVIDSLISVCNFNVEQAEQCTILAHFKGKCILKSGSKEDLLCLKEMLADKNISSLVTD